MSEEELTPEEKWDRATISFENLCHQDTAISLGDRTLKYFFISDNCDKLLNEEQKAFL